MINLLICLFKSIRFSTQ